MRHKQYYRINDRNVSDRIRWCRENFGPRGQGWDFSGGFKGCDIIIWRDDFLVTWILMWE